MNTLVWGEVQSGKTKWICELLFKISIRPKLIHNLTVFLAGSTKDLKNQAKDRVIQFYKEKGWKHEAIEGFSKFKKDHHITIICYLLKFDDYTNENHKFIQWYVKTKPVHHFIFIMLKNVNWLKKFKKTILKTRNKFKFTLIDDECDFFSISNEELGLDKKINTEIHSLLKKDNTFINPDKYTISATPFEKEKINVELHKVIIMKKNIKHWNHFRFLQEKMIKNFRIINPPLNKEKIAKLVKEFIQCYKALPSSQFLINPGPLVKETQKTISINEIARYLLSIEEISNNTNVLTMTGATSIKKDELLKKGLKVIVGGIKVSRGITFDHLRAMLLYTNNSTNIKQINFSNTLQKARWCGYESENKQYKDFKIFISQFDFIKYVISAAIESRLRFFIVNNGKKNGEEYILSKEDINNNLNNWLLSNTIDFKNLFEKEKMVNDLYKDYNAFYNCIFDKPIYPNKTSNAYYSESLVGIDFGGLFRSNSITCVVCDAEKLHEEITIKQKSNKDNKKTLMVKFNKFSYNAKDYVFSYKKIMYLKLHINKNSRF